jgi:hypothetical protein
MNRRSVSVVDWSGSLGPKWREAADLIVGKGRGPQPAKAIVDMRFASAFDRKSPSAANVAATNRLDAGKRAS